MNISLFLGPSGPGTLVQAHLVDAATHDYVLCNAVARFFNTRRCYQNTCAFELCLVGINCNAYNIDIFSFGMPRVASQGNFQKPEMHVCVVIFYHIWYLSVHVCPC